METRSSNNSLLIKALKILGAIILIPLLLAFGWIAGAVWLLFFRKKLSNDPERQKKLTIIVSALSALSLILMIYSLVSSKPLKSIQISSDASGQELEIDQDYIINIAYEPENATLSEFTYQIDNPCATFEKSGNDNKKAVLHTKSEGTVIISVSDGTIKSNTLEFTIVDNSKEIEKHKDDNNDSEDSTDENDSQTDLEESTPEEPPKTISGDINIDFSENVQNDTTGNWRLARVNTPKEVQEYALEYCNSYFQSDDEIHAVINSTLNTTNKLAKITSDTLDVSVYDYVDKEELDAKALFSGTLLAHYEINLSTGEVTEIPLESESTEGTNPAGAEASAEPVNETEPENPSEPAENTEMVWLSATGDKYHSIPNCGRMNPNKARQISKADAEASGIPPCSKCY